MVDYVREKTAKKSFEYGKYGSFEHLLLFVGVVGGYLVVFNVKRTNFRVEIL